MLSRLAAYKAVISLRVSLASVIQQPRSNMTSRCSLESCSTSKLQAISYSRVQNPLDNVASKICALEGGTVAMLTSSTANFASGLNIAGGRRSLYCAFPPFTAEPLTCLLSP